MGYRLYENIRTLLFSESPDVRFFELLNYFDIETVSTT